MENAATQPPSGRPKFDSAFTLFKPSMHAVGINFWTFVLTYLAAIVPAGVLALLAIAIPSALSNSSSATAVSYVVLTIVSVVALVITFAVYPSITWITLQGAQGRHVRVSESLRAGFHFFWRYMGLAILMMLMILVSLILLVVPFFFVAPRIMLAPYYMIDRDLNPLQAIKQSMADYKRYRGTWGVIGVIFLVELPAAIPFVGWIPAFALAIMYACAPALRYFQIKNIGSSPVPSTAGAIIGGGPSQPVVIGSSTGAMRTPLTNPMPPQAPAPQLNSQPPVASPTIPPQQPPTPPRPLVQ